MSTELDNDMKIEQGSLPALERKAERMTTAPAMPDFAKTVNAVVIRSSV